MLTILAGWWTLEMAATVQAHDAHELVVALLNYKNKLAYIESRALMKVLSYVHLTRTHTCVYIQ